MLHIYDDSPEGLWSPFRSVLLQQLPLREITLRSSISLKFVETLWCKVQTVRFLQPVEHGTTALSDESASTAEGKAGQQRRAVGAGGGLTRQESWSLMGAANTRKPAANAHKPPPPFPGGGDAPPRAHPSTFLHWEPRMAASLPSYCNPLLKHNAHSRSAARASLRYFPEHWHRVPLVYIYLVRCETVREYTRGPIRVWEVDTAGRPSQESKDSSQPMFHAVQRPMSTVQHLRLFLQRISDWHVAMFGSDQQSKPRQSAGKGGRSGNGGGGSNRG